MRISKFVMSFKRKLRAAVHTWKVQKKISNYKLQISYIHSGTSKNSLFSGDNLDLWLVQKLTKRDSKNWDESPNRSIAQLCFRVKSCSTETAIMELLRLLSSCQAINKLAQLLKAIKTKFQHSIQPITICCFSSLKRLQHLNWDYQANRHNLPLGIF